MTNEEMVSIRDYVDARMAALEELNKERFTNIKEAATLEAETKAQVAASNAQNHILLISISITMAMTLIETGVAVILHFIR